MDFGKFRRTAFDVSTGMDLKKPRSIAWVQVAVVGLKHAACRNLIADVVICPV
jgi:hypothetical protein